MAIVNSKLLSEDSAFASRVDMMSRYMDLANLEVLEIGAYDRPTFRPDMEQARFLDYRTTDQLLALSRIQAGRDPNTVAKVDYVANSNLLSTHVDRKFNLVVANHVIEHVPNIIEWLIEVRKILGEGGFLFLSVPDRRYTFDYLRRETDSASVIRRFVEGVRKPTFWDILDARYNERPAIAGDEAWEPDILSRRLAEGGLSFRHAFKTAREESALPYCDVHCSVFTSNSFKSLFSDLSAIGCDPMSVVEVSDVEYRKIEFHALLRANPYFDENAMPFSTGDHI